MSAAKPIGRIVVLCGRVYQGSRDEFSTSDEWIASAVNRLDAKQKAVVVRFLTELLGKNPDVAELRRIWDNTTADYYFGSDVHQMRRFLAMIRDVIGPPERSDARP